MAFLLKLKAWSWQLGAALLAVGAVVLRLSVLKHQRDVARDKANRAEAQVHINKVEKIIKKKRKEELSTSLEEVEREVKKKGEDFEGLDNLSNPNDW